MTARVTATGPNLPSKTVIPLGEFEMPVAGLNVVLPITFEVEADENIDIMEEEILQEAREMIEELMPKLALEIQSALTNALRSSVWSWKGGSRDIYDTGELARSVRVEATGDGIRVSYSAPYADIVHNGGYVQPYGNKNARPVYLPPRPWVSSVLYGQGPYPQFDFEAFIERNTK